MRKYRTYATIVKRCKNHHRFGDGTVIGNHGFGFTKNNLGEYERNPHEFKVIIGSDVEIGSNCNIDRGSWRDTIIGDGTKIDALVHIAHNVQIGENCLIGAGARILGSVTIGDNTTIWSNAVIHQRIKIGNNCIVGACSYVRNDIPDNQTWYGTPARYVRDND